MEYNLIIVTLDILMVLLVLVNLHINNKSISNLERKIEEIENPPVDLEKEIPLENTAKKRVRKQKLAKE